MALENNSPRDENVPPPERLPSPFQREFENQQRDVVETVASGSASASRNFESSEFKALKSSNTAESFLPDLDIIDIAAPGDATTPASRATSRLPGGAALSIQGGFISHAGRTDGSSVGLNIVNGAVQNFTEKAPGKPDRVWSLQNNQWVANDGAEPRQTMSLGANGNLDYVTASGIKHTISGHGEDFAQTNGMGKVEFDAQGRIKQIDYADGEFRNFAYTGAETQPSGMAVKSAGENEVKYYSKVGTDSWARCTAAGAVYTDTIWTGDINLTSKGSYLSRDGDGLRMGSSVRPWNVRRLDGERTVESVADNGAVATFDKEGRFLKVATDERELSVTLNEKGHSASLKEVNKATGETVNWTYSTETKDWRSDSPNYPEARRDMVFDRTGDLRFKNKDGVLCFGRADGNYEIRSDNSTVVKDSRDRVVQTYDKHGNFQKTHYDGDTISGISTSRAGKVSEWDSKLEPIDDLKVDREGNISYIENDGTTVHEDANQSKRILDGDKIQSIKFAGGASRTFSYNLDGSPRSFTDTASGGKESRTWSAETDDAGKPTGNFVCESNGTRQKLLGVSFSDNGDVHHQGKDHNLRISRALDLAEPSARFLPSVDLEQARGELRHQAALSKVDGVRLNEFIDTFEKRCAEARSRGLKAPTEEQIKKTYDTFTEMLKAPNTSQSLTAQERAVLVKLAMHNIANPRRIDQGQHPTCNITTTEIFTASREPQNYARLLKEVSTTGSFSTASGAKVTPPRESLAFGVEESSFTVENATANFNRNWASQIYQATAINATRPEDDPYVDGNPSMDLAKIQAGAKAVNGYNMPYFVRQQAPTASEMLKLKQNGDFPVGVHTLHAVQQNGWVAAQHVQTLHDAKVENGQVQVLLDDQHGESHDANWVPLGSLFSRQQLLPPKDADVIPTTYLKLNEPRS